MNERHESRGIRVAIVDSGGFSPPYDFGLAAGLEAQGVQVTIVGPSAMYIWKESPDAIPVDNGKSSLLRLFGQARKLISHGLRMIRLVWRVSAGEFDVVHFQWLPIPALDLLIVRLIRRHVPVIFTMHNTSLFHGTTSLLRGLGLDACLRSFDQVIVHSRYSLERVMAEGVVCRQRIQVIPHGALTHYRDLVSTEAEDQDHSSLELLFAGSIKPYKGLADLIEALAALPARDNCAKWRLTVAGHPGMDVTPLIERAEALGVGHSVRWLLRHQSERELARLLHNCDVVVLPYREIDQSGVLMAAVGVGRPVVATEVGAFPEIVEHEVNGVLVPAGDRTALGKALRRILSSPEMLSGMRSRMEDLGTQAFSWAEIGTATKIMYQHVVTEMGKK